MILGAWERGPAGRKLCEGDLGRPRGAAPNPWGSELRGKKSEGPPLRTRHLAQYPPDPALPGKKLGLIPSILSLSSRAQRLFQVEPLEEAFAELVGADHDGTRGGGLDDPWEEACSGRVRLGSEVASQGAPTPPRPGHTQTAVTCKEAPGARLGPDPPQQQPGGVSMQGRHCRHKARPSQTPRGPPPVPTSRPLGSSPLTASTAPSATWR